jgi:hypothetical protein
VTAPLRSWTFEDALAEVAVGAPARDADPAGAFPEAAVAAHEAAGAFAEAAAGDGLAFARELALVRAVARADMGVARILDGHLNAVERLRVHAEDVLRDAELAEIATGRRRAGVWGADPAPGEGPPARLEGGRLHGVKTFCSGAGGLDRAIVLVGSDAPEAAPLVAWIDLTVPGTVTVDPGWFRGAGMRASASHRVVFDGAPVLAVLGAPGALTEQPWFARDAVRTAASWAGAADAAVASALDALAARPAPTDLEALAAGRLLTWQRACDLWPGWAADALEAADGVPAPALVAAQARSGIADAARAILDEAERACGSRPLTVGSALDRAGRDLRLFLLQHRLEPILARTGRAELERRAP